MTAWSLLTVPLAFLVGLLRSRLARGGLADLFSELRTMPPAELQAALARVLHDPAFAIAYPDGAGGFADADGPARRAARAGGRPLGDHRAAATATPVAALIYDRSLDDDPELIEAVGGATVLALENRALQAQAAARLAELQASRERIVTAADAERRRIERNLHDGAQQGLVTLALQLSLIQRRIRDDPADAEQLVASASDQLAHSLAELRELARGIHPAALEQGLPGALEALVLRSAVPTDGCRSSPDRAGRRRSSSRPTSWCPRRWPTSAKHAGAAAATVRVCRDGADAVVEISDDGGGGADPAAGSGLRGLADRVEALGGRFKVGDAPGGGTVVIATLPLPA